MLRLEKQLETTLLSCCRCLVATDRRGRVAWTAGADITDASTFTTSVDLIASAVRRLGHDRDTGAFETIFMRFEDELLLLVAVEGGHICLLAGADTTPGLLFSHVRRVQLALTEAV